jgi:methyl-accepting chemotaxis protein
MRGLWTLLLFMIERILQEDVYSIVAAEEILAELAQQDSALAPEARTHVRQALDKAKRNVTEEEERAVLAALEGALPSAMAGERAGRRLAVASIRKLIRINRDAMRNVDLEARRLGSAGAWTAVFIGFLSFLLSIVLFVRLQRRLARPLVDLYEVLESARQGDHLRRCRLTDAPREIIQVTQAVNGLLDARLQQANSPSA